VADSSVNSVSFFVPFDVPQPVDTAPPVVTVPDNISVEGNTLGGASLTYDVTATDDIDSSVTLICIPPSGSLFPLGTTTVVCTAEDTAGNMGTGVFSVTVVDTTPPTITCPPSQEYQRASEVPFANPNDATASDIVDESLIMSVSESPATGSNPTLLTRTYTATDHSGNSASCIQIITIIGVPTIADLISEIESLNLSQGTETSLLATLNNAQQTLDDGNPNNDSSVCGKLDAFLEKVDQNEAQGKLSAAQAEELRTTAEAIMDDIACP
jgi:hypothetical protein